MSIRIFITGGTFDKEYNELTGELYFKDTHMKEMLALGRCKLDVEIRTLMMIDSLKMTDDDRDLILRNCKNAKEDKNSYNTWNRYYGRYRKISGREN